MLGQLCPYDLELNMTHRGSSLSLVQILGLGNMSVARAFQYYGSRIEVETKHLFPHMN